MTAANRLSLEVLMRLAMLLILVLISTERLCPADLRVAIARSKDAVLLRWDSQPTERFDVLIRSPLSSGSAWTPLATNLLAGAGPTTEYQSDNSTHDIGFYRVLRHPTNAPAFTFASDGTNFVYTDAQRSFTGIFLKPSAQGTLPAIVVSHGAGGTPNGYSLSKAREFLPWNLIVIAPTLTHVAGGETNAENMGFCDENLARITACVNVLASRPDVDTNRIALFGHSMGAFATIGSAAVLSGPLRAAAISAGGIIPDAAGDTNAAPTVSQASPNRVPLLMVHCDGDPVVPAARSLLLQQVLNSASVPNQRVIISSNAIPVRANWHNIHNDAQANALLLTNVHAWFRAHGVLP